MNITFSRKEKENLKRINNLATKKSWWVKSAIIRENNLNIIKWQSKSVLLKKWELLVTKKWPKPFSTYPISAKIRFNLFIPWFEKTRIWHRERYPGTSRKYLTLLNWGTSLYLKILIALCVLMAVDT